MSAKDFFGGSLITDLTEEEENEYESLKSGEIDAKFSRF
jgi:hypothetical protein